MTFKLPRAAIFDWDNTLVDSWGAIMIAQNKTLEHFGREPWPLEVIKKRCRLSARDSYPGWFGDRWQEAYDLFYKFFDEARAKTGTRAYEGSQSLLEWFKAHDIPCAVVSNKRGAYLREECSELGWDKFFVKLVGSGDATRDKPARDTVDMALQPIGVAAGPDDWFIGDTDVDMQCARNSGCREIFVGDKDEATELGVKLAFEDCVALKDWLETQVKKRA